LPAPGSDGLFEIIGVARDVPNSGLRQPPAPLMYIPYTLMLGDQATLVVRTDGDPLAMTRTIQEKVREVDPNLPLTGMRTAEAVLSTQGWAQERFVAALLGGFAGLSLIVACAGLYSVVSYAVSQRLKEFGIRIALGASVSDVIFAAVRTPLIAVLLGLGAGIVLSAGLNRMISSWSFGNTSDPIVIIATSALLLAVTMVSLMTGVRRTASLDPLAALRSE
jgi:hypothetical protein